MNKSEIAEAIAEITNVKALEVYRTPSILTQEARVTIDGHLIDLSTRIVKELDDIIPGESILNANTHQEPEVTAESDAEGSSAKDDAGSGGPASAGKPEQPPAGHATDQKKDTDTKKVATLKTGTLNGKPVAGKKAPLHPAAERMKKLIKDNKATPEWMAEITGVTPPTIRNLLKGAKPHKDTAKKIRVALDAYEASKEGCRHPIADEIEAYMARHRHKKCTAAKELKISYKQLLKILSGQTKNPQKSTIKKISSIILAANKKTNKKKTVPARPPKEPVSKVTPKVEAKGPVQFVQLKLGAWMGRNKYGNKEAAEKLIIKESEIRDIMNGQMPSKSTLIVLGRYIPDIHNNLRELISQSKAQ